MYREKLVIAVKHNGRVLREQGDTVHLPFGSEFTLFFKNLNSLRCLARVSVDGQDATENVSLIVPANGTLDLERFIKNGNLNAGNRFKFIERTAAIENGPRGIQAEDGLIRVEFEFERQPAKIEYETIRRTYVDDYYTWRPRRYLGDVWCSTSSGGIQGSIARGTAGDISNVKLGSTAKGLHSEPVASFSASATCDSAAVPQNAASLNDVGITVPGSVSEQQFSQGAWFPTDGQKHVIVLKLAGHVGEKPVKQAVTVNTKPRCISCGHQNKATAKFCSECGTGLELV